MPDSYHDRRLRGNAFKESQYPVVSGTRCVQVHIPDDPKFLHQLAGLMAMATKQYQYQNWDSAHAAIIAQQWRDAYLETDWSECMDCEKIIDCIENDEDVQQALLDFLAANNVFSPNEYPVGQPLPIEESSREWGSGFNPTCDNDILWSQSLEVVDWACRRVTDILEVLEVQTNIVEQGSSILGTTVIGDIAVDDVAMILNNLQSFLLENFNADITDEYKWDLACEILCQAQEDCVLNLDIIFNILKDRVEAHYSEGYVTTVLTDMLTYIAGLDMAGQLVADVALMMLFGAIKLANFIMGGLTNDPEIGQSIFELILKIAVNGANNDWLLLCEECAEQSCYDTGSIYANLLSGSWIDDSPNMRFARASALGDIAEFEIDFGMDVELVQFTYESQTLTGGAGTLNTGACELWKDGSLVLTVFSFSRATDGGYTWGHTTSVNAIDSTTGAGTVFDTIKFRHQHVNRIADVRGEVCVIPV